MDVDALSSLCSGVDTALLLAPLVPHQAVPQLLLTFDGPVAMFLSPEDATAGLVAAFQRSNSTCSPSHHDNDDNTAFNTCVDTVRHALTSLGDNCLTADRVTSVLETGPPPVLMSLHLAGTDDENLAVVCHSLARDYFAPVHTEHSSDVQSSRDQDLPAQRPPRLSITIDPRAAPDSDPAITSLSPLWDVPGLDCVSVKLRGQCELSITDDSAAVATLRSLTINGLRERRPAGHAASVAEDIARLTQLRELVARDLDPDVPIGFAANHLPVLERLQIHYYNMCAPPLSRLEGHPSLSDLDIVVESATPLDRYMQRWGAMPLRKLRLQANLFPIVEDLACLAPHAANLTHLTLGRCRRCTSLAPLSHCSVLVELSLLDLGLVTDLSPLGVLLQLERLVLTGVGTGNVAPLAALTSLRHLALNHTLELCDITPLHGMSMLRSVGLVRCPLVTSEAIAALLRAVPGLIPSSVQH